MLKMKKPTVRSANHERVFLRVVHYKRTVTVGINGVSVRTDLTERKPGSRSVYSGILFVNSISLIGLRISSYWTGWSYDLSISTDRTKCIPGSRSLYSSIQSVDCGILPVAILPHECS